VLDELSHLNIEFVSLRENIDTGGPLGRAMVVIVGAIAELEGRRIGRAPLNVDRATIVRDRLAGLSLTEVAKKHRVSRATVRRLELCQGPKIAVLFPSQSVNNETAEKRVARRAGLVGREGTP